MGNNIELSRQIRREAFQYDFYGTVTGAPAGAGDDRRFHHMVDDSVLERAWLWRAVTARACGLAPDASAERHLEQWISNPDTRAATAGLWSSKLGSGVVRLAAARFPIPHAADEAAHALDRASKIDPAELVSVFVAAAADVAATVAGVERILETPATVAADMVCFTPTYQNLDMFAVAILDAVTDARLDLAVALLAGVIQGLRPVAPAIVALDPYIAALTAHHPLPATPASPRTGRATTDPDPDLDADVAALAAHATGFSGFAVDYGWDRAGRTCAALIVETAIVVGHTDDRSATAALADLLARWTLFEQDIPAALGMRARRER